MIDVFRGFFYLYKLICLRQVMQEIATRVKSKGQ